MKLNHNGCYVTIDGIQSDILCYFYIADSSSCTPISSERVKSEEMILIV